MPPKGRDRLRVDLKIAPTLSKAFYLSPCLKGLRSGVTCQQSRWAAGRKTRQTISRQFPTPICRPIPFDFLLTDFARRLPITKAKRGRTSSDSVKKFCREREFLAAIVTPSDFHSIPSSRLISASALVARLQLSTRQTYAQSFPTHG